MFLNGDLLEEVYNHPQGFIIFGKEKKMCRLHKAFYVLKETPCVWYAKIDEYLNE
jgi:hypothetical protein